MLIVARQAFEILGKLEQVCALRLGKTVIHSYLLIVASVLARAITLPRAFLWVPVTHLGIRRFGAQLLTMLTAEGAGKPTTMSAFYHRKKLQIQAAPTVIAAPAIAPANAMK